MANELRTLRTLLFSRGSLSVYLPSFLVATGEGAILPTLPVTATDLGAGIALAGLVTGLILIGEVIGDLPSGWVVSRLGENHSMITGAAVMLAGALLCLCANTLVLFSAGVFLMGLSTAVFALARHTLLTVTVPTDIRARALSLLGGTFRAGYFLGPFIAAAVIAVSGTQMVFLIPIVACATTVVVLLILPDPAVVGYAGATPVRVHPEPTGVRTSQSAPARRGLFRTIHEYWGKLARMGTGAIAIGLLRPSRQTILPLWAVHLNLDAAHTSLIMGVAGAVDFALFYTSGQIMDRFGRAWSAVPSLIGLGLLHIALPLSGDIVSFSAIAILMSVANGIGSGILMTLGADLAPRDDPAPFLGAWRFFGDSGNAAAPFIISGLTAVAGLALPAVAVGALGLGGAILMARFIPRFVPPSP